jgi:hypothetical protein
MPAKKTIKFHSKSLFDIAKSSLRKLSKAET